MTATRDATKLSRLRHDVPVVAHGGYFNSGFTGPLCRAAQQAMASAAAGELTEGRTGPAARARANEVLAEARGLIADLIGAGDGAVALTHHATDGVNIAVQGLDWRRDDNVVTTQIEHKGVALPLGVLRRRHGVQVRAVGWTPGTGPAELRAALTDAIDAGTRLVVVSHVAYVNGVVLPVADIARAARKRGALLLADGAQAAGAIRVDVTELEADMYTLSGQKWLCGPEGTGALYVAQAILDRVQQNSVGWASCETWQVDGYFTPNKDATRFEVGTRHVPAVAGLSAAIRWLREEAGLDWACERGYALAELARSRLARLPGVAVLTPAEHAGLVSFQLPGGPDRLVAHLAARDVYIRSIFGYDCARLSVGFFHTEEEIIAVTRLIEDYLRGEGVR